MSFHREQGQPVRRSAWVLYIPVSTLSDWDKEFDKDMRPFITPEKRGKACKVTLEVVRQVVEKARQVKNRGKRILITKVKRFF